MVRAIFVSWLVCLLTAAPGAAQGVATTDTPAPPAAMLANLLHSQQLRFEQISANHWRATGQVEIDLQNGVKFFADQIDGFLDANRLEASGNVVFANSEGLISADRVEFDTASGTGTFYQAAGLLSLGEGVDRAPFGNQDPDVYFYGETIERTGPRQYRLTRGGFTTCVQPTPRWEFTGGTVELNLNNYAIARNLVLRVKGVPLLYVPFMYYPIQDDDRATGFLLPTYGASTLRGQAISNAFFWAIDRSQDATFFHDWFTRAGQGAGAEYRYVSGPRSMGDFRFYRFSQQENQYEQDGRITVLPANTSYQFTGAATHGIAQGVEARARLDYFSDIVNQQLYQQNIYQASRTTRVIEGGLSATRGPVSSSLLYQQSQSFGSASTSVAYGSTPRITGSLAPQRLFNLPIYGSVNAEYAHLPFRYYDQDVITRDDSLHRVDLAPTVRLALSPFRFLSFNTSATYRTTYYSRSSDGGGATMPAPTLRRYLALGTALVGPVLNRVWQPSPTSGNRLKHVIEPVLGLGFTSAVTQDAPMVSDLSDFVVGGSFQATYGVTNRFFHGGGTVNGTRVPAREFATVGLQQTYYWNPQARVFDPQYTSSHGVGQPMRVSPIALNVRVSPNTMLDATARLEYDVAGQTGLQALTSGGTMTLGRNSTQLNISRRQYHRLAPVDNYLSASTSTRMIDGRATGSYSVNWDIGRGYIVSQSVTATYLAQCCGIQAEFQTFNFPPTLGFPIAADRRINLSIVLAGVGTFSNFFGAFGGLR